MNNRRNERGRIMQAGRPFSQLVGQMTMQASLPQSEGPVALQETKTPQTAPRYQIDDAQAEVPGTSWKPKGIPRVSIRVNSEEEVDQMSDQQVHFARLSGASKKRLNDLIKLGQEYIQAKRNIIKDNLARALAKKAKQMPQEDKPIPSAWQREQRTQAEKTVRQGGNVDAQKRYRQDTASPSKGQRWKKKARLEDSKEDPSIEKVAITQIGFPKVTMEPDQIKAVQSSIMEAYEGIPIGGPQVRFVKCTHRPGYLVVACADATSAEWLREIVPTLQPWEGASLKTLAGNEIPGLDACTVFVPDEHGQRLDSDRILARLRVSNKGLNTSLWTVFGKVPFDRGQLWTFSMDRQSMEELERLEMWPYFGMGRLEFRPKDQSHRSEERVKYDTVQRGLNGGGNPQRQGYSFVG